MKIAKFLLILLILVSATVGTVILLSSKPNSSQTGDRINIVASANFWGDVAKQIGGDRVNVTSVISDPEADPHLYESSASNAAAQRLSANPVAVTALSITFALLASVGGLLASLASGDIKTSVFVTMISFAIYVAARLATSGVTAAHHKHV